MNVTQISISRAHHFHLARQLEKRGLLREIWTGYPRVKLKDEQGIAPEKIKTYPWLQTPYMLWNRFGLQGSKWLKKDWEWLALQTLDKHVAASLCSPTTLVALSAHGLFTGTKAQKEGGYYICDRGASHIVYQDRILKEEYKRWGFTFHGVDPRVIAKEEAEYQACDKISVPSEFVMRSFLKMGVPADKIEKIVYGARFERFQKNAEPSNEKFTVIWVGTVGLRKGFMYLLEAFQKLRHPQKELLVIGAVAPEVKRLIASENLTGVQFLGHVSNEQLPHFYSKAHVFALPSLEEGLAMVQGEALSCGCPIIATSHTGAEDLFTDGKEGFVVPIRSSVSILERMEELAQDKNKHRQMSEAAVERIKEIRGWDFYGDRFAEVIAALNKENTTVAC